MEDLYSVPVIYKALPQRGKSAIGTPYDPLIDCDLSLPSNRPAYLEVKQLLHPRFSPKNRPAVGVSLQSSKIRGYKKLLPYIDWLTHIQQENKNPLFYVSTDSRSILEELLHIFRWFHPPAHLNFDEFFIKPNNFYNLEATQRWVADVNLLANTQFIISTPSNLKSSLAQEISGIPVIDTLPADSYCYNLQQEGII